MECEVKTMMSASVGKIAEALCKVQPTIHPVSKDAANPFFKSKYATLASCMEAIKPLYEAGICVLQPPVQCGPDGVCVTTLLIHTSGEWIRGELYMPAAKRDPQGFGSAISYARRYCLSATIGLATEDDDGERAMNRGGAQGAPARKIDLPPEPPTQEGLDTRFVKAGEAIGNAKTQAKLDEIQAFYKKIPFSAEQMKMLDFTLDARRKKADF